MLPKFDDMLTTLVSEPSISSTTPDIDRSNLRVIEHLANWLDGIGFNTELMPLPDNPKKANLIASYGPSLDERGGLVLAGHTDTVPYDESKWQTDPFTVTERDDKLFGLGSCDMKGFFPVAMEAVSTFLNHDLKAPITIVATSDEESSMAGARYLASKEQPKADYAIIGEPTGLRPVYAHKGIAFMSVKLQGESGHSSNPDLGCNALDAMHDVMSELIQFRQQLATQNQNPAFDVNVPTLNLGCLHAGDSPNRICGRTELHFDLRMTPNGNNEEARAEVDKRLQAVAAKHSIDISLDSLVKHIPPFEQSADSELVTLAESLTGHTASAVAFATEAPFLQQLGMETIVMGPGSIDRAHQPDEYMELEQMRPCVSLLQSFIERYCL